MNRNLVNKSFYYFSPLIMHFDDTNIKYANYTINFHSPNRKEYVDFFDPIIDFKIENMFMIGSIKFKIQSKIFEQRNEIKLNIVLPYQELANCSINVTQSDETRMSYGLFVETDRFKNEIIDFGKVDHAYVNFKIDLSKNNFFTSLQNTEVPIRFRFVLNEESEKVKEIKRNIPKFFHDIEKDVVRGEIKRTFHYQNYFDFKNEGKMRIYKNFHFENNKKNDSFFTINASNNTVDHTITKNLLTLQSNENKNFLIKNLEVNFSYHKDNNLYNERLIFDNQIRSNKNKIELYNLIYSQYDQEQRKNLFYKGSGNIFFPFLTAGEIMLKFILEIDTDPYLVIFRNSFTNDNIDKTAYCFLNN